MLAERAPHLTFWQSNLHQTLVLDRGYLESTVGLTADVLTTRIETAAPNQTAPPWRSPAVNPLRYTIYRSWTTEAGASRSSRARAVLDCARQPTQKKLPLTTRALQKCREVATWASGDTTQTTLWRGPATRNIWAVKTTPFPGGPALQWQVAKAWWR